MLAADGIAVAADDVRLLLRRTEGWPAGMRLAALFLKRDPTRDPASFAGDDQAVTDYLVGEVLASQPADMQRFLLRTSVAERLSSGLAEALTDAVARATAPRGTRELERVRRRARARPGVVPLPRTPARGASSPVGGRGSGRVPDLHRRAAHWFAGNGRPIEAMRHAADAQDWHLLGRIFVTSGAALVVSADRTAVERVLHRIPRDRLDDGPDLLACAAARLLLAGRFEDMHAHLERAQDELRPAPGSRRTAARTSPASCSPMAVLRSRGDVDGVRRAAMSALDELSGPALSLPAAGEYRAIALGNLGTALLWAGRLEEAEQRLTEGLVAIGGHPVGRRHGSTSWRTSPSSPPRPAGWARASTTPRRRSSSSRRAVGRHSRRPRRRTSRWRRSTTAATTSPPPDGCSSRARRQRVGKRPLVGPSRSQGRGWTPPPAGCRQPVRGWPPSPPTSTAASYLPSSRRGPPSPSPRSTSRPVTRSRPTQLIERVRQTQHLTHEEAVCAARALLVRGEPRQADEMLPPLRSSRHRCRRRRLAAHGAGGRPACARTTERPRR